MNTLQQSPAFLRKRKMLLVLPVLILPFVALAFWSMGGGRRNSTADAQSIQDGGLNLQLPDARLKDDKGLNKLSYYQQAAYDSAKRAELLKNDPFYRFRTLSPTDSLRGNLPDSNEEKVYKKLADLDKELNNKNSTHGFETPAVIKNSSERNSAAAEVNRLERMMQTIQQTGTAPDPELNQLNGMLDKIMDIQHPERISEIKTNSSRQPGKVFPVSLPVAKNNISLLVSETETRSGLYNVPDTGFYSTDDNPGNDNIFNAIEAVIHDTRTLVNGATVKLRLLSDIYINGNLIEKGNFIFGKVSLNDERLTIDISSLRYKKSILPVSLTVYDLDGMEGIFIPGAISRDVAKESSDRALQGIALNSLDPSVGAQAASAGIDAAKNLLSKKIKLVRVLVKAGYKVLLKDKK